ncbi:MAG: right-handed parallel beta-helix repeat-containing protein [Nanoarchaeota archaeon]
MSKKRAFLLVIIALVILPYLVYAGNPCVAPQAPMNINDSTTFCSGTYTLTSGDADSNIFNVTNSSIRIDCNASVIIGDSEDALFNIYPGDINNQFSNITITNGCNFQGFTIGILVNHTNNSYFTDIVFNMTETNAINVYESFYNTYGNLSIINTTVGKNMLLIGNGSHSIFHNITLNYAAGDTASSRGFRFSENTTNVSIISAFVNSSAGLASIIETNDAFLFNSLIINNTFWSSNGAGIAVRLEGVNITIDGNRFENGTTLQADRSNPDVNNVIADNWVIKHNIFNGTSRGDGGAVEIVGNNVSIINNTFTNIRPSGGSNGFAIMLLFVNGSIIANNTIKNATDGIAVAGKSGTFNGNSSNSNVTISGNFIDNISRYGITVGGINISVLNNSINNVDTSGIYAVTFNESILANNTITYSITGITIGESANFTFVDNNITHGSFGIDANSGFFNFYARRNSLINLSISGMRFDGPDAFTNITLIGNVIKNSSLYGILFSNVSDSLLDMNIIETGVGADSAGIIFKDSSNNSLINNSILRFPNGFLVNDTSINNTFTNNTFTNNTLDVNSSGNGLASTYVVNSTDVRINSSAGIIYVQWFAMVNITLDNGSVGANLGINISNTSLAGVSNGSTGVAGTTDVFTLTEYYDRSSGRTYETNFTANATNNTIVGGIRFNLTGSTPVIQVLLDLPPLVPKLDTPGNNTVYRKGAITALLNWSNTTDPDSALHYVVEVSTDKAFSTFTYVNDTVIESSNTTGVETGVLSFNTYYWRVLASDNKTNSSYSAIRTFTVDVSETSGGGSDGSSGSSGGSSGSSNDNAELDETAVGLLFPPLSSIFGRASTGAVGAVIDFNVNDGNYVVKFLDVKKDLVILDILGMIIKLKLRERRSIDLDNDGIRDIRLQLKGISNGIASVSINAVGSAPSSYNSLNLRTFDGYSVQSGGKLTEQQIINCFNAQGLSAGEVLNLEFLLKLDPCQKAYTKQEVSTELKCGGVEAIIGGKARLNLVLDGLVPTLSLNFDPDIVGSTEFCSWCFNNKKDHDETGVDCGGASCASCDESVTIITPDNDVDYPKIILFIISILIVFILSSYLPKLIKR